MTDLRLSPAPNASRAEWLGAAVLAAAVAVIDWQLVSFIWRSYFKMKSSPEISNRYLAMYALHDAWRSAMTGTAELGVLVFAGAVVGALVGLRNRYAPLAQRFRSAMVGALLVHAVLPVALVVFLANHPPQITF
ncbi:hypothetical protein GXW82_11780 [Streptacidiphilus sp. 4-A2]|nr:hypothetical protein [Streptacidiphilus sp. 4-A2]